MLKKHSCITIIIFFLLVLGGCGGKMTALDVDSVKDKLIQLDYYNDDLLGYSLAGMSDIGGLINDSWMFCFYDYGEKKEALDEFITILISDELDKYVITERSNYTIYEREEKNYVLFVRVDNTLLWITGPGKDKEEIRSLARDLGYYT